MKKLSDNWFFEGLIDFEYKKYVLLAYLQDVEGHFKLNRLYPHLGELVRQYSNLLSFVRNKKSLQDDFPVSLEGFDMNAFKLKYKKVVEDDELMEELEAIVNFSVTSMKVKLEDGREIYEFIEKRIFFESVGVVPLQKMEGLLLLKNGSDKEARAYTYRVSLLEQAGERYRAISTHYLESFSTGLATTYINVKEKVMRNHSFDYVPAAYAFESELTLPWDETFLPITKRLLAAYLAQGS